MKTFKTPKGIELSLLQLKGKDYLPVQQRIFWFREEHPTWSIMTEIVSTNDLQSIVKASIITDQGIVIATGLKHETKANFKDHLEKAESGAIGRALGFSGYGTLFAQELDEGDYRIADAPQPPKPQKPIGGYITDPQGKRLWAITKSANWTESQLKLYLKDEFGITSSKEIPFQEYDKICKFIESHPVKDKNEKENQLPFN